MCEGSESSVRASCAPLALLRAASLRGALAAADLLGTAPREVLLVGIVPAEVSLGLSLSPAVEAALPRAVEAVAAELERLGFPCPRRAMALSPRAWWEREHGRISI